MKAFHAYDIRGVYNKDFNKEDVYKIGFFLPELLKTKKVLVGRDARPSSDEIFEYLARGINDAGADVYYVGLATTPMVYYGTAQYGFEASVQITASHNPREYNGLKISRKNALPVGYDTGLKELENMIKNREITPKHSKGQIIHFNIKDDYLKFLRRYMIDLQDFKIGVDCSNGMAGLLIKDILGNSPIYLYDELDGTFPNHEANPLLPENRKDLEQLVRDKKLDIGIIFDGDADRVMFVDQNAEFVPPDLIIALLGHYFFEEMKQTNKNVLQDIRTSKSVEKYLTSHFGAQIHIWRVGRAYAALKLREIDGLYGGELAGHYYFKDFFYSDSGLLSTILVLRVLSNMKKQGISFSEIIDKIKEYHNSGEINFRIQNKQQAIESVVKHFVNRQKPNKIYDFDGYRIEYDNWWFNIRPSNTEPYLRLLVEAKDLQLLQDKIAEIKKILADF